MRKKKKTKNKKKKISPYDNILMCFEKVNESLKVLNSVSKSLKTSASILKGSIKSNLAEIDNNMKTTVKIIDHFKSTDLQKKEPKYLIFDAKDFKII